MSPEARSVATALAVLASEIAEDRAAMRRHQERLEALDAGWPTLKTELPQVAFAAVELHAWYSALESIFERTARAIDQSVPGGEQSHTQLLRQMTVELPSVRPPVVPTALFAELDGLMKFRHFFRHAYRVDLDADKVHRNLSTLLQMAGPISAALDALDAFLASSLERLAER